MPKNLESHKDERGEIHDIFFNDKIEHVAIIDSKPNTLRGNHYHKNTDELFIILEGKIRITLQAVLSDEELDAEKKTVDVQMGDVFKIDKNVNHIFEIKENSKWLNILSKILDKNSPDLHRIIK